MPNLTGNNQYGEKNTPSDEELRAAFLRYAAIPLNREQQIYALGKEFDYHIRLTKLTELRKRLGIPTVRTQKLPIEEVTAAVVDEMRRDPAKTHGPEFIQTQLRLKLILAPRDLIRSIMLVHDPTGFDLRFPGAKNRRVARVPLTSAGPYSEISGDGHEKISAQALRMGGVGFNIYGYKDKFTDSVEFLRIFPDIRSAGAGGHIMLDFVEETGYIPIQLTTDKGSEVGWMYTFMSVLREIYAPDIDPNMFPFHVLIKSIHNTIIEGFWRQLKEKLGLNLKDWLLRGKLEFLFNTHNPVHEPLFYWVFAPVIQLELDNFMVWWNNHRVRHQHEKIMPSGHVPSHAMQFPELFGALDCRIKVPREAVALLREQLTEEEGSREQFQSWPGLTAEFNILATEVYENIGAPELNLESSWDVFTVMAEKMTTAA
ncbi:hypothetical protein MKEN_00219300 [Mycena kentingensis (nom. inval.)]|nr:hypothetical protein MKEN_00219300 [Mycena kentingensis (nom. inval.)]